MRILFLSDNFPPETNAPASRLHEHARRWVAAGHEVIVVTGAPNFPQGRVFEGYKNRWYHREVVDGIEVRRVKTFIAANKGTALRTLDYVSFMVSGFFGGLFVRRPDVVVGTSPQFFTVIAAWALAFLKRRPFVFELRDIWPASIEAVGAAKAGIGLRVLRWIEVFLYRRAKLIVAVTHAFKRELVERGVPAEKIEVVMNGVDLDRYAPLERDDALARELGLENKLVVGYVGTHGMAHALENVLDAATRLRHRNDVHFLFVGDGAAREGLVARAAEMGLSNVTLHPPQPKERMPAIWSVCDVSLVHLRDTPLFSTVVPSKLFEAMGMGLPILIACPKGEATGIVEGSGAGVAVAPEAPEELAATVARWADETELRAGYARASLESAPKFSRERKAREMLELLQRLLVRRS